MLHLLAMAAVWQPVSRPNIVMIFSDDHARQAISAYGSQLIQTPGIDRMAREGVLFARHYTANPLCAPSRATLLTGKTNLLNGQRDNSTTFDGSQITFPKLLQGAGYQTAVIGKWHLVSDPTGFDHWEVLPGQGAYYNPEFLSPSGKTVSKGYVTEIITDKALGWLKKKRDKPFFLLVGHKAPHRNWVPGPKQLNLFNDKVFPEPATLRTDHATLCSAAKSVQMRLDTHMRPGSDLMVDYVPPRLDPDQQALWKAAMAPQDLLYKEKLEKSGDLLGTNYQRYLRNYLRCVAAVDESVGSILDHLDASGLAKNTVVIYASDQGFFLGENAWFDKRWFYEPSAGTPLMVRVPGAVRKRVREESVTSNLDLAPTILELAGLAPPKEMQGQSLASMLQGSGERGLRLPRPPAYGHFYESDDGDHKAPKYVAIATARHKLIFYYELKEWELFDLSKDPNETRNLWPSAVLGTTGASGPVRAEMVRKLVARMRELQEEPEIIGQVLESLHGRSHEPRDAPFPAGGRRRPSRR